jgi:hypothetical protein
MTKNVRNLIILSAASLGLVAGFQNCSRYQSKQMSSNTAASTDPAANGGAGGGAMFSGQGSSSVPTATGIVARLTNGLQGNVSQTAGNFKTSLASVKNNLPKVADPSKASGFDQVELLVYAACSDLVTGGTSSKMTKVYLVPTTGTIAANQTALVNAGVKMFDQYVAGLATQGPTAADVTASFTKLLTTLEATASNTTTIGFMSVCIAANTAGSTLMGF